MPGKDSQTEGKTVSQTDGQTQTVSLNYFLRAFKLMPEREDKYKDRQSNRQADTHAGRRTDRQADGITNQ